MGIGGGVWRRPTWRRLGARGRHACRIGPCPCPSCDHRQRTLLPPHTSQTRCQVHPVPFILEEEGEASVEQQLDAAVQDAARDGKPIRALLVTNPNNPLGIIYRTETIEEMILWAASRGIHLVRRVADDGLAGLVGGCRGEQGLGRRRAKACCG